MNEDKFNGKGETYARFRPGYPREWLDYLYSDVGVSSGSVIADVGSGTGALTRQLLQRGSKVYAVEPNAEMRKICENSLAGSPGFVSVIGTAENTTLAAGSVDFVTAAQAFHWFDRCAFRAECVRILKQSGRVVLVWNSREAESKIVLANGEINRKYCPDFRGFSGGTAHEEVFSDFFYRQYEEKVFANPLQYNKKGFIGRSLSASYALKACDRNYDAYISELETLFDRYSVGGILTVPNRTRSYCGRVREK